MANISSYPNKTPKLGDIIIFSETYDVNAASPVVGNPTKSTSVSGIGAAISPTIAIGTINTIPMFTTVNKIGDSPIVFDGTSSTTVTGDLTASNDLIASRDLNVTRTANIGGKLVLNPEGEISNPVSNTSTLLFAKTTTDNTSQISVNKKLTLSGNGGADVLNFLEFAEIESSSVFPALELNSESTPQIIGKQLTSEFKGQGGVHKLYANLNLTELGGDLDKDIRLMYGDSQSSKLSGTGSDTINFIAPYFANLQGSNDNATVTDYCGVVSTEFTTGAITITDSYIGFGSYGLKNANLVVNEYIGYYHDSPQANLATENYFMKNIVDMPLYTVGSVVSKDYKLKALNTAPNSSTDTGVLGEIRYTSDAIYVCIATNTWRKSELLNF